MSPILQIAVKILDENDHLCTRCLGRLFGKLGYGLSNTERGMALNLFNELKTVIDNSEVDLSRTSNQSINSFELDHIIELLENFKFNIEIMTLVANIIGYNYRPEQKPKDNKKNKNSDENTNPIIDNTSTDDLTIKKENNKNDIDIKIDINLLTKLINKILSPEIITKIREDLKYYSDSISHEYCDICQGLFDDLPRYVDLLNDTTKNYEFNDFLIGCKIDHDIITTEEEIWSKYGLKYAEPIKAEFNRELGKMFGTKINMNVDFDTPDMTIVIDTRYDNIKLQIASLFIYGRYRKYVRDLPQTKWPCKRCWGKGCDKCNGTGKIYPTSLEEEIAKKVMAETQGSDHSFHGMGREDIGVRMLGNGRPFILEIIKPVKRGLNLERLQDDINKLNKAKLEVSNLKFTNHRQVPILKAAKPSKTYQVKVEFEKKISKGKLKEVISTFSGRIINQRTPDRVAHRRADLVRKRKVHHMVLNSIKNRGSGAEIEVTGESGLYIKELVNGDSGRTEPSLASELGTECTVAELDVLQINDEHQLS